MIDSLDLNTRRDQTRRMIAKMIDQRIYLAFSSEIGLECHGNLAGLTAVGLHALIRESKPSEYVGPLPAICVIDSHLRSGEFSVEVSAMLFDAVVLHELAHVVSQNVTAKLCPTDDQERLRDLVQVPWTDWQSHTGVMRWAGHGIEFIRALLHLRHRMASRGHWTSLTMAFSSQHYGLSSIEEYRVALGEEPQRTSWLTLAKAMAGPMPEDFQQLWARDVSRSTKPLLKGAN